MRIAGGFRIGHWCHLYVGMVVILKIQGAAVAGDDYKAIKPPHTIKLLNRSGAKMDSFKNATGTGDKIKHRPILLQGSIEHSDHLSPVIPSLKPGIRYDAAKISLPYSGNKWYKIPAWLAGTWKQESTTCYYSYNYKSFHVDYNQEHLFTIGFDELGWQQDRLGGIWQYQHAPYVAAVDGGEHIEFQYVQSVYPIKTAPDCVVLKFRGTTVHVDKLSRRILETVQVESFQTYMPYGRDYFKCLASIKVFDDYGRPARLQKNVSASVRTEPFAPIGVHNGVDIRAKFREFLLSHNLNKLLP